MRFCNHMFDKLEKLHDDRRGTMKTSGLGCDFKNKTMGLKRVKGLIRVGVKLILLGSSI